MSRYKHRNKEDKMRRIMLSMLGVLNAMNVVKQPELIETEEKEASVLESLQKSSLNTIVAPISMN